MRQHKVPTVNSDEAPKGPVSRKDTELEPGKCGWESWCWKATRNRMHNQGPRCTTQLSACPCVPECLPVRKSHGAADLGAPVV